MVAPGLGQLRLRVGQQRLQLNDAALLGLRTGARLARAWRAGWAGRSGRRLRTWALVVSWWIGATWLKASSSRYTASSTACASASKPTLASSRLPTAASHLARHVLLVELPVSQLQAAQQFTSGSVRSRASCPAELQPAASAPVQLWPRRAGCWIRAAAACRLPWGCVWARTRRWVSSSAAADGHRRVCMAFWARPRRPGRGSACHQGGQRSDTAQGSAAGAGRMRTRLGCCRPVTGVCPALRQRAAHPGWTVWSAGAPGRACCTGRLCPGPPCCQAVMPRTLGSLPAFVACQGHRLAQQLSRAGPALPGLAGALSLLLDVRSALSGLRDAQLRQARAWQKPAAPARESSGAKGLARGLGCTRALGALGRPAACPAPTGWPTGTSGRSSRPSPA